MADNANVMIYLDALLDTRLGTVHQMNPDHAVQLFKLPFGRRKRDDFRDFIDGFDHLEYRKRYAARDKSTLKVSRLSAAILTLNMVLVDMYATSLNTPERFNTEIDINVYPYEFNPTEAGVLRATIQELITVVDWTINIVSFPYEEMTPARIKNRWSVIIMYDFWQWFLATKDAVLSSGIGAPQTQLFVPRLYLCDEDHPEETREMYRELPTEEEEIIRVEDQDLTLHEYLGKMMSAIIKLDFLEPDAFTLIPPPKEDFKVSDVTAFKDVDQPHDGLDEDADKAYGPTFIDERDEDNNPTTTLLDELNSRNKPT